MLYISYSKSFDRGWRGDSAVKNALWPFKGPEFGAKEAYYLQLQEISASGLWGAPALVCMCAYIDTHIHIIKNKKAFLSIAILI